MASCLRVSRGPGPFFLRRFDSATRLDRARFATRSCRCVSNVYRSAGVFRHPDFDDGQSDTWPELPERPTGLVCVRPKAHRPRARVGGGSLRWTIGRTPSRRRSGRRLVRMGGRSGFVIRLAFGNGTSANLSFGSRSAVTMEGFARSSSTSGTRRSLSEWSFAATRRTAELRVRAPDPWTVPCGCGWSSRSATAR